VEQFGIICKTDEFFAVSVADKRVVNNNAERDDEEYQYTQNTGHKTKITE
jgi:hypothetical protein